MSNVIELHPRVLTLENVEACAGDVRRSLIAIETAQDALRAALATGVPEALSLEGGDSLGAWTGHMVQCLGDVEELQGVILVEVERAERLLAAAARCER